MVTDTVYNELNLPKVVTDATGKTLTYSYNAIGKINTVTDQFGNTQTYGYDVCGRNNKVTDDLDGVSEVEYDLLGNVTRLKGPLGGATNYTYDQMGRLTSESTTSGGTIRYQYNELNLRKNLTNARGHIIHFSYDKNGRIGGYTTPEDVVTFEYDDNGNITRTRSGDGDIHRTFDELNRVTSYTDICCNRIGYEYDEAGNLKKLTYPDNTSVSYEYDENNNLKKVTDWAGRVTEYTYDKNNRVIGIVKPNGTTVTTTYERNKVKTTVEKTAAGAVITGFEYTYDNLSRVTEEKVLANSTKVCYNYDDLSRVTERTIKNLSDDSVIATETFTYDKAGNIMSAPSGTFQYDTNNRLVVFNGQNVSYDCDGNMTLGNGMDCGYDSQNRLLYAGEHDYFYNAENVRIRNLCADEDTSYVYDTNCKLSRLLVKTTNGVTTKYVYGLGLIGEEVNNTFKTYHFDSRGSTVAITDANGNITDTFAYDTYGKRTVLSGTSDIIFGYNGRDGVVTDKNGLIYMRARYYSPDMRRFINADIIAGEISNAITLNRYAYANGNPVMNIDPMGLSGWDWLKKAGSAVGNFFKDTGEALAEAGEWFVDKVVVKPIEKGKEVIDYIATDLGDDIVEHVVEPVIELGKKTVDWVDDNIVQPVGEWLEDAGEWLNENARNKDGSYALYDNQRFNKDAVFHEQILAFTPSGPSFDLRTGNIGLGSLEVDAITGGWEGENANLSLLDFGHAEAGAEIKNGDVKFGALASIWSPSFSFSIGKLSIDIGAEVGAVGAGFKKVNNGFSLFGAYGFGGSLTFSLND